MAMWGVTSNESGIPESSGPDKVGNLLNQADFIVVMEGRQRNCLARLGDYSSWNKIHLFLDYCTSGKEHLVGSVCGDLDYQTLDEEMTNLIQYQKAYSANAKTITTVSDMLDIILGLI